MGEFVLIPVPDNYLPLPNLIGPFECPVCAGNMMLDGEVIERGFDIISCPYCYHEVEVPDS